MKSFFLFIFISFFMANVSFATEKVGVDEAWLKLLFYQKKAGKFVSLVENDDFFLSSEGRISPDKEYQESLRRFLIKEDVAKCDFPARFMYFKKKGEVLGDLSECGEYQKFLDDVQPKAVTMLFTNAYMNNPSSLFGHTLFRIDTKRKGTQLLAHGANFGANTGDETGALYVLKGLWGGYYGSFGIKPYYDVINLYNNIENRDIWEYELNFNEEELNLFVALMWEMQRAKVKYYFASKNCSYMLLAMIEAAKPELSLTKDFSFYTVPLDTLKKVSQIKNLVKKTTYRPSRQSKLKYRKKQMNKAQYNALKQFIYKDQLQLEALTSEEQADVLETAYQYVQYKYVDGDLELKDYRKKSFKLLKARSEIKNQKQYFDLLKDGENPVYSHQGKQVGGSFGVRNGKAFQEISFKPLYNSLNEDSFGMLKGAEINFLDGAIRHYDEKNNYKLQKLDFLTIKSLTGVDVMFQPFSYEMNVGYKSLFNPKTKKDSGALTASLGGGQGYALNDDVIFYIMSVPQATYGGGIEDNGYLGLGFKGGMYYNKDKIRLQASAMTTLATNYWGRGETYEISGGYGLSRNVTLAGHYKRFCSKYKDDEEIGLGLKFNF